MKFKIEKNIPIPARWEWEYMRKRKKNLAWPFKDMEVGDSFLLRDNYSIRAASASKVWGTRHKRTFTCQRVSAYNFRLWRTS